MKKIHEHLMRNSRVYAKWHQHPQHSTIHKTLFVLFCIGFTALLISPSHAAVQTTDRPTFGLSLAAGIKTQRGLSGEDAIQALGRTISTIARAYGMSTSELKHVLRNDHSARIDTGGLLFYAETELPDPQKASLGDGTIPNNPTLVEIPDELTFQLHSKPSQSAKVWLNFKGATTQGTQWNNGATIVSAPFSIDSDPAFSSAELNVIKAVWRSVAEDYAAFDVDVTTEPTTNYSYDKRHFTQVIISPSWEWFGQAGGVAYVNSFTWGDGTPAFIFSSLLGNNAKYIAEATPHEVGHTVGLYHTAVYDSACNFVQGYSYGYGSNPGWGPIMGAGYYVGVSQWTKSSEWPFLASSLNCTREQDDLSIMTSALKFSADDVGNTAAGAKSLSRTVGSDGLAYVDQVGLLTQNDTDLYALNTIGGDINISVKSIAPYGNLIGDADFSVRLLDGNMNVVAQSNPPAIGTATVEKLGVPSGTYYIEVATSGYLDLSQPGGYSTYGSMGQYQVVGTYVAATPSSDTTAPTVSITNPLNGATLSGSASIVAQATDNVGIDHVDFYRDTTLIGADSSAPYSIAWDTTTVTNGTYTLTAKAYDATQNSATSAAVPIGVSNTSTTQPDTTAPLSTVVSPLAGATLTGLTTLSATASDNVLVTKVSFFDGTTLIDTDTTGAPEYAVVWDTTTVANGSHTIIAKAYDAAGNVGTSNSIIVYVSNVIAAPVVTIMSPQDGAVITTKTGNVTVQASATGANSISRMTLSIDNKSVSSVRNKSAISYRWGLKNLAAGEHTIQVEATDSSGITGTASVTITKQ